MCIFKAPSAPQVTPAPMVTDFTASNESLNAAEKQRQKAAAAAGMAANIKTSSQGDTSTAPTAKKSLLGG